MKSILLTLMFLLVFSSTAFSHSGRTDSCGGHNNRKTGGYHVHNYSKYNNCYPKKESSSSKSTKALTCDEKVEAACNKALMKCLDVCKDSDCNDACLAGKVSCE